jgi:2-polyprenyl-6-methoxyphenol hydroxylase-like FAD-dependent oxidoreductase
VSAALPGSHTAIVVGAGIGGLAAAIALRDRGWEVTVLERESGVEASGAALAIWPNGTRALQRLGLEELTSRAASTPMSAVVRRANGKPLIEHDAVALTQRYGAPLVALRRSELLQAQYGALDEPVVRFDASVTAVRDGSVELVHGSRFDAELIVGADGLHSQARLWVAEGERPRPSGLVAFRGLTRVDLDVPFGEWWGPGAIAGLVPLHDGGLYWYLCIHGDRDASLDERLEAFAPVVGEVIRSTPAEQALVHELFDRRPGGAWCRGQVALLGDAAHAMLPFLGQGACSSLEDAVVLADVLDTEPSIEQALQRYQRLRRPIATRLIRGSRVAGDVAMLRSPIMRRARDFLTHATPGSFQMRRLDPILGPAERSP